MTTVRETQAHKTVIGLDESREGSKAKFRYSYDQGIWGKARTYLAVYEE